MRTQPTMNLLYHRVSLDADFLVDALEQVVKSDEFIRQLVHILNETRKERSQQRHVLLIQRADYMCHEGDGGEWELKQIEVNNIAAG